MDMAAPSWGSVALIVFGVAAFLADIYLKPRKVDVRTILNKNVLRWEAPVLIGIGIAMNFFPFENIVIPAVIAFFMTSGIGIWMGMREIAVRKKRGENLDDE